MKYFMLLLTTVLFLLGCSASATTQQQTGKIACLGDSLTSDGSYISYLQEKLPQYRFDNFGVSGNKSWDVLRRLTDGDTDIPKHILNPSDYDAVIVFVGINNVNTPKNVINDLKAIYKYIHLHSTNQMTAVIACTLTPWGAFPTWSPEAQNDMDEINVFIRTNQIVDYLADIQIPLEDSKNPSRLAPIYAGIGDGLHPTREGYIVIAKTIIQCAFFNGYLKGQD